MLALGGEWLWGGGGVGDISNESKVRFLYFCLSHGRYRGMPQEICTFMNSASGVMRDGREKRQRQCGGGCR